MAESDVAGKGTLATSVYEQLRADLLSGRLEPDTKVRVEWVVSQYGAGASPVREALNRLASEGLLDRQEQRGFSVVPISEPDLDELTRTRCLVEGLALREAIKNHSVAWEEEIVLALHRLSRIPRSLPDEGRATNPDWEQAHRRFHRALIAACGSRWLIGFCEQLADQAFRYRQIASGDLTSTRDQMAEHRTIAELTVAADADRAAEALVRHYQLTRDLCREWLRQRAPQGNGGQRSARRRSTDKHESLTISTLR
jgi:DNA-binding GntR family transcriptional regulator